MWKPVIIFVLLLKIFVLNINAAKRIAWNYKTIISIANNGDYCRVKMLKGNTESLIFQNKSGICFGVNLDGNSNSKKVYSPLIIHKNIKGDKLQANPNNPELLELKNGRLLYVVNYRPLKGNIYPFSIVSKYSDDYGISWSEPVVIYKADTLYENGCWEPALLQLPDGRVQVYFANENNFRNSNEQEISMIESFDNGESWAAEVKRVSYSHGKRDGMPVPKLYGDSIFVTIEDNTHGKHQPSIVSTSIKENWEQYIDEKSPFRSFVMQNIFSSDTYGGAPYLAIDSKGTQYISCQSTYKRTSDINNPNLLVAVRENGKIVNLTYPFDIPLDKYGKWGAIELINDQEIMATTSSNIEGQCAPYAIRGYILEDSLRFEKKLSNSPRQLFIGHKANLSVWTSLSYKKGVLFIQSKVSEKLKKKDKINYYFSILGDKSNLNCLYRLTYVDGNIFVCAMKEKEWKEVSIPIQLTVKDLMITCSIPCPISNMIYFTMCLTNDSVDEYLVGTDANKINSWFKFYR